MENESRGTSPSSLACIHEKGPLRPPQEPELLKAEADRVRRQKQDVAVSQYRAFIAAAECTSAVRSEVAAARSSLASLLEALPTLSTGCRNFASAAEALAVDRAQNRALLQQHAVIQDLLELPQLMEMCVRNGNYDEALDLEGSLSKLVQSQPRVPLVVLLGESGRGVMRSLLGSLIAKLCGAVQLPECLRVVGYLRRMAVFSEPELRLAFLRCREAFLAGVVEELDSSAPYEYLKRLTDAHRARPSPPIISLPRSWLAECSPLPKRNATRPPPAGASVRRGHAVPGHLRG